MTKEQKKYIIIIIIMTRRPTKEPKEYESYPQAVVALSRRLRNRSKFFMSIIIIVIFLTITMEHQCDDGHPGRRPPFPTTISLK